MVNETITLSATTKVIFYTPEDIDHIGLRLNINTAIVACVNIFCCYIVRFYSTPAMGEYKYFILFTIISSAIMDFHLSFIWGPVPLFPIPGFCSAGFISKKLDVFWGVIFPNMVLHATFSWTGISLGVAAAYRYAVMAGKQQNFFKWYSIAAMVGICIIYPITLNAAFLPMMDDRETVLEYITQEAEYLLDLFEHVPCNTVKIDKRFMIYAGSTITHLLFAYFVSVWCAYKMYKVLVANKSSMSENTYKLYSQMVKSLCFQLSMPFMCLIFPILAFFVILVLRVPNTKAFSEYAMQCVSIHSLTNCMCVIIIIKPYRTAFIEIILKIIPPKFRPKPSTKVFSIVASTSASNQP